MRRSARERKAVDYFTVEEPAPTRRKSTSTAVVSSSDDDSSDDEDHAPHSHSHSHSSSRKRTGAGAGAGSRKAAVASSSSSSSNPKRAKKAATASAAAIAKCRSKNYIFHAISSNKALSATVDKWYNSFGDNHVGAMAVLINSLLLAAGSREDCIPANMDLEGLDSSELEEVLSDMALNAKNEQSEVLAKSQKKSSKGGRGKGSSQQEDIGYAYPLGTLEVKASTFRAHFQSFWRILITKVLTLQQQNSSKKLNLNTIPMRILLSVIEIFMALSNVSSLPSVRHAVTDALLQTSSTILAVCVLPLRAQIASSRRQSSAASGGRGSAGSAKRTAINALQSKAEQSLEHFQDLINTIFNTIFAHRYKDYFPIIRSTCAYYLGQFMLVDPHQFVEDTYLKYLGWLANDKSAFVRRAVVTSLVSALTNVDVAEAVALPQRMKQFSERFIDRWVEMAVGDVDEEICFGMLRVLREFQRLGLIDDIEQEKLDVVDKVVFDANASARVRAASLQFLMDHTEGFEEDESDDERDIDEDGGGAAKKRSSSGQGKRKSGAGEELRELKRKRRVAVQLETLAEFVEYHLGEDDEQPGSKQVLKEVSEALMQQEVAGVVSSENLASICAITDRESNLIVLLAEACLALPKKSGIMRDWDTFVSLLLRESDNLITTALQDCHISTVLRFFVCSAIHLYQWKHDHSQNDHTPTSAAVHVEDYDEDDETDGIGVKRKRKTGGAEKDVAATYLADWHQLVSCVVHSLPKLLTRFSDNASHVTLLLQLLDCCAMDISIAANDISSGSASVRFSDQALRLLFKAIMGQLEVTHSRERVCQIASILRLWVKPTHVGPQSRKSKLSHKANKALALLESGIESLVADTLRSISTESLTIQGLLLADGGFTQKGRRSANSSIGSADLEVLENSLFELSASVGKFSGFWQSMDCRPFMSESVPAAAEILENASNFLLQLATGEGYERFFENEEDSRDGRLITELYSCCQACAKSLQAMCLWYTRDVFLSARQICHELDSGGDEIIADEEHITVSRDHAILLRDTLVVILSSWLAILPSPPHQFDPRDVPLVVRQLQGEAFRLIGDVRLQFPVKLRDDYSPLVSPLAWEPSADLMNRMEEMFSREELLMHEAIETLEGFDDEEDEGEADDETSLARLVTPSNGEQRRQVTNQLVWTLLNPLGTIRFDVDHINRRQAAAILGYLVFEVSPPIQSMVNSWLKKLKEKDMGKYLESMLLALKKSFEDHLLSPLKEHQAAVELLESYQPPSLLNSHRGRGRASSGEVDREEALEQDVALWTSKIQTGWSRVSQLSKRFAQTLGVGKCSGEVAGYVVQLLQVATKYGLQSVHHLAFFQTGLESFLGHLRSAQLEQVRGIICSLVYSLRHAAISNSTAAAVFNIISQTDLKHTGHDEFSEEDKQCASSFAAFGLKVSWKLEDVADDDGDGDSSTIDQDVAPVVVSAEDVDEMLQVSPVPTDIGGERGRRRTVGGRRSSVGSRYTSVGDDGEDDDEDEDEMEEDEEEEVTVTVVAGGARGNRTMASGLHLEGIDGDEDEDEPDDEMLSASAGGRQSNRSIKENLSQGVSTQSSGQSEEDLFEEFDLRKSRRRFG